MSASELSEKEHLFELLIHDLTSPLSVISASAARLLRNAARNGSMTERETSTIERILRNAHRSQLVLQEMIEILRSGEGFFRTGAFPVDAMLREAILEVLDVDSPETAEELARERDPGRFRAMLEGHGIFITISGRYAEVSFSHDLRKVQQIVRNLLSNALKHRRQRVAVTLGGDADLVVSVEDDGPGIPEEHQQSIFRRFVQLDDGADRPPGLGLGLAGVRALVNAMRGSIVLVSREGLGTRFSVSIPPLD